MKQSNILVTGGCGFIGSNFIRYLVNNCQNDFNLIVNYDCLTYAGCVENIRDISNKNHIFINGNINDRILINKTLRDYDINIIVNFAAETHVDRSIDNSNIFFETNVNGVVNLLNNFRGYTPSSSDKKLFIQISTDEVYGSLTESAPSFIETSPLQPSSPYSASKAAAELVCYSYYKTYGLPVIITNCSNNYGPYQFPEKLIPLMTLNALEKKPLPVYGNGRNIRDWIHVDDHSRAVLSIIKSGKIGEKYNIGGNCEMRNIDIINHLCDIIAEFKSEPIDDYKKLINYVTDRPGHDWRYSVDFSKLKNETHWEPIVDIKEGLRSVVKWYMNNTNWREAIHKNKYQRERLGVI